MVVVMGQKVFGRKIKRTTKNLFTLGAGTCFIAGSIASSYNVKVLRSPRRNMAAHSVLRPRIPALPSQIAQQLLPGSLDGHQVEICGD